MRLNCAKINANFNILKTAYHSLFESHLQYGTQLWCQKNNETIATFQKLKNRALRKMLWKAHNCIISCVYKECQNTEIFWHPKSTKLSLYVPNPAQPHCPNSVPPFLSYTLIFMLKGNNYRARSTTHTLLDIPWIKTNVYGKNSIKNHCPLLYIVPFCLIFKSGFDLLVQLKYNLF